MTPVSPISSPFFILSAALTVALLAALCLAPVKGNSAVGAPLQRHQRNTQRQHCAESGSCSFYSKCLNSNFSCGNDNFIETYAKERCNVIRRKLHRGVVGGKTRAWAHQVENCFQKLLEYYPVEDRHPDPQTCLARERDAIGLMNSCYARDDLKKRLLELPSRDVHKIIELFRLGGHYYNTTIVDQGLVKVYADGNETRQASLQSEYTTSTKKRIILCVQARTHYERGDEGVPTPPEEIISAIISKLGIENPQDVHYAGTDEINNICFEGDHGQNTNDDMYHLVNWFTNRDIEIEEVSGLIYKNEKDFTVIYGGLFELTSASPEGENSRARNRTRCGDGIRQVLEDCDFASNYPACTLDCRVQKNHDCTAEQLEPSQCWAEQCGDGLRTQGEKCDDGNTIDGDGCSSSCIIEHTTHTCTSSYNMTSTCTLAPVVAQQRQAPAKLTYSQSTGILNQKQMSSAASGEAMKRTVDAVSSSGILRYSLCWTLGLLAVSLLSLR